MSSIKEMLEAHRRCEKVSFHMPGHKGTCNAYDVTELTDTDDLLSPEGPIKELLEQLKAVYGQKYAYIGTNGATGLLMSALMAVGREQTVVLSRASHQSLYHGLIQNNQKPIYLAPDVGVEGFLQPPKVKAYEKHLSDGQGFIFCTPNYEGYIKDYDQLADSLKDKVTLLDGAHGSHLKFINKKWSEWMTYKVFSFHKTLGGLNQTAVLLSSDDRIEGFLPFYQTTSPSFPHILSVEASLDDLSRYAVDQKYELMAEFKALINGIEGFCVVATDDPSKVLIQFDRHVDRVGLVDYLKEKGIYFEIEGNGYLLGILTIYDKKENYDYCLEILKSASEKWQMRDHFKKHESFVYMPEMKLLPGDAFYAAHEWVDLDMGLGRISGDFYIPYPPGIPLLVPGEVIDEVVIETIKNHKLAFHGNHQLSESKIIVVK